LPNSDEWCREVDEALFGDVDALPQPDQPASVEFPPATEAEAEPRAVAVDEVDAALFGTTTAEPVAPPPLVDEIDDETIIAEPADVDDAPETSGPPTTSRRTVPAPTDPVPPEPTTPSPEPPTTSPPPSPTTSPTPPSSSSILGP
jgi:hypothetical protein